VLSGLEEGDVISTTALNAEGK